ncbi:MAG TPA: hypothetical protein VH857_09095 [Actinomycetes bacterium]|jgi:hypothetical protein|nr:hypothetical protein [Actinomycetes bacterium]
MRRIVAAAAVLGVVLLVTGAPPAQAGSVSSLGGSFAVYWPLPADQPRSPGCDPTTLCGAGSLAAFGPATITVEDDSFTDGSPCLLVDRVETVRLLDGSGDLILQSRGTVCFPGRSQGAASGPAYGNPSRWSLDGTVDGPASTGRFAGASGDFHEDFSFAGAVGQWRLSGAVSTG